MIFAKGIVDTAKETKNAACSSVRRELYWISWEKSEQN